jgi:hypothetical protein
MRALVTSKTTGYAVQCRQHHLIALGHPKNATASFRSRVFFLLSMQTAVRTAGLCTHVALHTASQRGTNKNC